MPVSTLVNSGATDNFINKSPAMLAAMPQRLPIPIHLTLFNSSSTSAGNITHYVQTTLTFTNNQQQDLCVTTRYRPPGLSPGPGTPALPIPPP
ncbi:hypothetical protein C0993_004224 [Termitomyces sp. T159_Od127]|nr:hypothetical protein C0993_004224 [Termitomyces sp. T159_Od127]